jgi:alanyl-tRNA synthetase
VHPLIPPQVLQPLGGKGGGKPTKAQGSAGDTSKLGDVLDLATKFAQSKLQ